jgi:hypothetical protein
MRLLKNLLKTFNRKVGDRQDQAAVSGFGLLIFEHTSEVIRAESVLKEAGVKVSVKGPPPEVRTGCDLAIEFPIVSELKVSRVLKEARLEPLRILPLYDLLLKPVDLFNVKDFGDYLMVRAANMKITIEKRGRRIVNISGGGCPDVPFLAEQLMGKNLADAPEPRTLGSTLCGYALQLAYEELRRRCPG